MDTTVRIKVSRLEPDAFAPFGQVLTASNRAPDFTGISSVGWKASFESDGPPEVMFFSSQYSGLRFSTLERHLQVTQTFIPLGGVPAVIAVAAPTDQGKLPAVEDVHAFLLDGSAGYILHRGTWHSLDRYPLYPPSSEIVIITDQTTQHELETVSQSDWQRTQAVDYSAEFGVTFELAL